MKKIQLIVLLVAWMMVIGCSRQQDQTSPEAEQATVVPKANEAHVHLTQQGMRVIAPAMAPQGAMSLYHKIGADALEAVMPPASGAESFVALIGSGDHDVLLTQDSCEFEVEVEVRNEGNGSELAVIKLSNTEDRGMILPGSDLETRRVTAHMAASAANNFGCNLMLRKKM